MFKKITIVGYGSQGEGIAKNLRDSNVEVCVGNQNDSYKEAAIRDGFTVMSISQAIEEAQCVYYLIPDEAQASVYTEEIFDYLQKDTLFLLAHGMSFKEKSFELKKKVDYALLAPRMTGHHIRSSYLRGHGVPAFYDIFSGDDKIEDKLFWLSSKIGYLKAGIKRVSAIEETELDLFQE
jgi:ketol-acid reductoisomerase